MLFGLGVLVSLVVGLYQLVKFYLSSNNSYWPKRGVSLVTPTQAATIWELITRKKTLVGVDDEYYRIFKERGVKYGGIMELRKPALFVMDLDLIKQICVKDFDHFVDRRTIDFRHDPVINKMLTQLEGQEWKDVRSILSPTFTTGKIKRMFPHFNSCGKNLLSFVTNSGKSASSDGGYILTIQDLVSRYTVDVIGATAFGMDTGALKDPESIFYKMAKRSSDIEYTKMFKGLVYVVAPKLANFLKLEVTNESFKFFTEILRKALKEREESKEQRDDFLQLIIEARNGELSPEDADGDLDPYDKDAQLSSSHKTNAKTISDDMAMSQCVLFFVVGFDTVGTLVNFAAYLMAIHQDIQEKLHAEVESNVNEKTGDIEYESVGKMEYLDKFVSEILRQYPPANRIERKCVKDYVIPDSNVKIHKGQVVGFSVQGIHHDEKYWTNPEKFDPERFSAENKATIPSYSYLPFGAGPRNCIGMRFALMEAKIAIAYLVHYFQIEPTAKTPIPVKIDDKFGANRPINDLELKFTPRKQSQE